MGGASDDIPWEVVRKCCQVCQVLEAGGDVGTELGKLDCVNGFTKDAFVVVEFYRMVVVAFEGEEFSGGIPGLEIGRIVDLQIDWAEKLEKLHLEFPKPVYLTGFGIAGRTALFCADGRWVSGVVTFALPEKSCESEDFVPSFPRDEVYSFQIRDDPDYHAHKSGSFKARVLLPVEPDPSEMTPSGQGGGSVVSIERFVECIDRAMFQRSRPIPHLDEVLGELMQTSGTLSAPSDKGLKSPLQVVVLHHEDDWESTALVKSLRLLFDGSARKEEGYLAGTTGLPGVLRVVTDTPCESDEHRIRTFFDACLHTVLLVLVDDSLADDKKTVQWLEKASEVLGGDRSHLLLPVGLHERAFSAFKKDGFLSRIQRTFATSFGEKSIRGTFAALLVLYQAYKLLGLNLPSEKQLKIFISHAKKDGLPLAQAIKSQIDHLPCMLDGNRFFDSDSLEVGERWDERLRSEAGKCVMVVLRTQAYESRVWCRKEFLTAMGAGVPMVVVDARTEGDSGAGIDAFRPDQEVLPFRQYPVTHVRDGNLIRPIGIALVEGLKQMIFDHDIQQLCKLGVVREESVRQYRVNSGEAGLLSICREMGKANGRRDSCRIVYHEPEMAGNRQDALECIIRTFFPRGTLSTCTALYDESRAWRSEAKLGGRVIGLSIAGVRGGRLTSNEANSLTVHVVSRIFSHGGSVAFGHDWRVGGVMEAVYDCMRHSVRRGPKYLPFRILNTVPWRFDGHPPRDEDFPEKLKYLKLESFPAPRVESNGALLTSDRRFSHALDAIALGEMRGKLNEECHARICIGGAMKNSSGVMAGILEEVALAISKNQPVYLCGHWGGATEAICAMFSPEKDDPEVDEFKPKEEVLTELDQLEEMGAQLPPGRLSRESAFRIVREYTIDQLSGANGLSVDDNRLLFELADIRQVMSLVLKGLSKRFARSDAPAGE